MTHPMTHTARRSDGDEYRCRICARHIVLSWQPYRVTVLTPGDDSVSHTGQAQGGIDPLELPPVGAANAPEWLRLEDG